MIIYYKGNEKNEWAMGEIGFNYCSGNDTSVWGLYYYSTLLKEIIVVYFDSGKKTIVNPRWETMNKGRIYYYLKDSIDYEFQQFWSSQHGNKDDSKDLNTKNANFNKFDIPIFKNTKKLNSFLEKNNCDDGEVESDVNNQSKIFYKNIESYIRWKDLKQVKFNCK
ncbi:hypothetical protein [Francisella hispaniensis]|uniref:Uncharacterized protein n=1 Tax=Francisella hispaniensis FSC454 TaxID=1088883 RepID=A0AAC9J4T4_9GAMM|nr:hypothetical protein [Francisella hispaniensis]APD50164.1 hypothetical protein FSC454_02915 [Francisella hispaniensis FSC454]KYW82802.1 hypothetical protein AUF42_07220 [Francisella hispaniensis FSC454]